MRLKLYVDTISFDEGLAYTETKKSIVHNLVMQGMAGKKDASNIFPIGNYICIINTKQDEELSMTLLDYRKSPEKCMAYIENEHFSDTVKSKVLSLCEVIDEEFDELMNKVQLIVGCPVTCTLNPDMYN